MGLSRSAAGARHPVLPGRCEAAEARKSGRRARERAADHDVHAARGRTCVQLRVPLVHDAGMAQTVRAVLPAVPRRISSGTVQPELREAHRGVVRAETSGRGLRGNICRLAHAAVSMAPQIQGLAGDAEAPLRRARRARGGRPRADRQHRRGGHHAAGHRRVGGAVLPAGGGRAAGAHRPGARRAPWTDLLDAETQRIEACGRYREQVLAGSDREDHLLDRCTTADRPRVDRFHLPQLPADEAVG